MPLLSYSDSPIQSMYDAVVVGSGPNGLAAAITIAQQGYSVLIAESAGTLGGGMRSAELTLPGFTHDVCSTIHAMAVVAPFFVDCPLQDFGLEWIAPDAPLAHPLENSAVAVCERSVEATADRLSQADSRAYRRLFDPLVDNAAPLFRQVLGPLKLPRCPLTMARFGWSAMRSAVGLARAKFDSDAARALFAGHAAHSVLPLEQKLTAAVGIMLTLAAHTGGWPIARGGSQQIADALAGYFHSLRGECVVNHPVTTLADLPRSRVVLFDTSVRSLSQIAGDRLPPRFHKKLAAFRYGPGAFKVDWALAGPIPWANPECGRAATVHVGGSLGEVAAAERDAWERRHSERPFVLVAQQSLFDASRAPAGRQTAWGYCHVPHGSTVDMTERIESQVERFAPGFRDQILARHVTSPDGFAAYNANYVGGDITGGVMDMRQMFTRPTARLDPYTTPDADLFLCSASTPPGGGVHGMCGYYAAQSALARLRRDG